MKNFTLGEEHEIQLKCRRNYECNSQIENSYCDQEKRTCDCLNGYKYYFKFHKCIFANNYRCNSIEQCATLDTRLTCVNNYCTCRDEQDRAENYLCFTFRKYCHRGFFYNLETTDCVHVREFKDRETENIDQNVEMFVVVLFFITSALFIASCINNYKNERAEKLRRRIAQQQAMNIFEEQMLNIRPDLEDNFNLSNVIINNNNQLVNSNINFPSNHRYSMYDSNHKKFIAPKIFNDLPPTYEEAMSAKTFSLVRPTEQQQLNQTSANINLSRNYNLQPQKNNNEEESNIQTEETSCQTNLNQV